MTGNYFKMKRLQTSFIVLSLLVGLLIASISLPLTAKAQIGPSAPPEKGIPDTSLDKLKNLKNFFSDKKDPDAAAGEGEEKIKDEPDNAELAAPAEEEEGPKRPKHQPLLNQAPLGNVDIADPKEDAVNPPAIKTAKLDDPNNKLGLTHSRNRLDYVDKLLDENQLTSARTALEPLKQWLVDCTEAHINLYKSLNKIPSAMAQAELEKQLALEFALLRDRSMFEMGKLYAKENQHQKAVKELVEVIKSQPKSKLGLQAYELLQQIGFTEQIRLTE